MIEIPLYGEVGAGKVVPFMPKDEVIPVGVPDGTANRQGLMALKVCGVSLEDLKIYTGDILICQKKFGWRHITPKRICIVYIVPTGELVAKKVIRGANTLTLRASGGGVKDLEYRPDDIEVRAIVVGIQKMAAPDGSFDGLEADDGIPF